MKLVSCQPVSAVAGATSRSIELSLQYQLPFLRRWAMIGRWLGAPARATANSLQVIGDRIDFSKQIVELTVDRSLRDGHLI